MKGALKYPRRPFQTKIKDGLNETAADFTPRMVTFIQEIKIHMLVRGPPNQK